MRTNIENALYEITDLLQNKVADYLDVNRQHIEIVSIGTNIVGEDYYDWSEDPNDACEGTQSETYFSFMYRYRDNLKELDYDEPEEMIWQHIEGSDYVDGFTDKVMTIEEFGALFDKKTTDPCSIWYEK